MGPLSWVLFGVQVHQTQEPAIAPDDMPRRIIGSKQRPLIWALSLFVLLCVGLQVWPAVLVYGI